jgi:hypothetical protein
MRIDLRFPSSERVSRTMSKGKEIDREATENRFLSLPCLLALPQARLPGADDRLGPVSNLQLGEDV